MNKDIIGKVYNKLKEHIIDTTGVLAASHPIFAISEKIKGLADSVSIANRIDASKLFYLGAGYLYSRGRDLYYNVLGVEKDSKYKLFHDALWGAIFGFVFNGAITANNTKSLEETLNGAIAGAVAGSISGFPSGYGIDAFRDLTDINPSGRLPYKIRSLPSKVKKGIAVGLTAASIGLMAAIYSLTSDKKEDAKHESPVEQIVSSYSGLDGHIGE